MTAVVLRGDAAALPLPDASVDLIVTSPPYFGLRSYLDGGQHMPGQVGDEATPGEYLDALTVCTREWVRVLKPGGSLFVNLGDKYSGAQARTNTGLEAWSAEHGRGGAHTVAKAAPARHVTDSARTWQQTSPRNTGIPAKSLIGLPWRYALRCVDDLGLILRAEIVWDKPNGLPESVGDRVRRSHEQVFHLVKQPRYYSAVDEVREDAAPASRTALRGPTFGYKTNGDRGDLGAGNFLPNPLGKLPGSVWTIPTSPLTVPDHLGVDHFAAYPPELVRRIVLGWSPREVCTACGEGRRPVVERTGRIVSSRGDDLLGGSHNNLYDASRQDNGRQIRAAKGPSFPKHESTVTGYACACPDTTAPSTPGVVLDPFGGTGTTALVASVFGRVGISVDLSADYCRLATWRTTDPGERARALDVAKPPVQVDGQLGLFDDLTPTPRPRLSSSLRAGGRECPVCRYRTQYSNRANCEQCGAERLPA